MEILQAKAMDVPPHLLDRNQTQKTLGDLFKVFYGGREEVLPSGSKKFAYRHKNWKVMRQEERDILPEEGPDGKQGPSKNIKASVREVGPNVYLQTRYELQIKWGHGQGWSNHTFMLDGELQVAIVEGKQRLMPTRGVKLQLLNGRKDVGEGEIALALFLDFHPKNSNSPCWWPDDLKKNDLGIDIKPSISFKESECCFQRELNAITDRRSLEDYAMRANVSRALSQVSHLPTLKQAMLKFGLEFPGEAVKNPYEIYRGILIEYALHNHRAVLNYLFGTEGNVLEYCKAALDYEIITVKDQQVVTHTGQVWDWCDLNSQVTNYALHIAKKILEKGYYEAYEQIKERVANPPKIKRLESLPGPSEPSNITKGKVEAMIADERIVKANKRWNNIHGDKIVGWGPGQDPKDKIFMFAHRDWNAFMKLVDADSVE